MLKRSNNIKFNSLKMNKFVYIAIFNLLFIWESLAQEELQCRGVDADLNEKQKSQIAECLVEAGIKSIWRIPAEKLACFGVCVLEKKDMLSADGKLDHDKILSYIYKVMRPEEVKKPLVDGVEKCMKEHGDKIKGKNDPTCMTFMEVGNCVHDVFLDICIED